MIKLINADIFDKLDTEIPDGTINLIATDPPYLINYKEWDIKEINFMEKWIDLCNRKLADNGTMWIFMSKDNLFTHKYCPKGLVNILQEFGEVHLENWITWSRLKGRGSSKHLKSVREEIIHYTKSKTKFTWNSLKTMREVITPYVKDGKPRGWIIGEDGRRIRWTGFGNSWVYSTPQFNGISEPQVHPSQKPVLMMERLIRLSSNEGDTVLDPFMGSGSTGVACLLSNRNFIGFEQKLEFFKLCENRINNFDYTKFPGFNIWNDDKILKYITKLTDHQKANLYKTTINDSCMNDYFQ